MNTLPDSILVETHCNPIECDPIEGGAFIPLNPLQQAIFVGQQLEPESPLYNMGMIFRIDGPVDVEKFEYAWHQTVDLADALRTRLYNTNSTVLQGCGYAKIPLYMCDLTAEQDPDSLLDEWLATDLKAPINLFGPLAGALLIKLSDTSWVWYCKLHHIITDAASYTGIWRQLVAFYESAGLSTDETADVSTGRSTTLITTPYQTFSSELTLALDSSRVSKATDYWTSLEIPPALSYYGERPSYTDTASARMENILSSEQQQALALFSEQPGIKSFNRNIAYFQVLLATLFVLIHRISNQSEISIATTIPNRSDKRFSYTPGLFVELLPVSVIIEPDDTFSSVLDKVRAAFFELMKFSETGVSTRRSFRDVSAVINYVPFEIEPLGHMPVNTEWLHPGHMDRQHALRLHITDWGRSGELRLDFECNQSCFDHRRMQLVKEHYVTLIDTFLEDKEQQILAVPLEQSRTLLPSAAGNSGMSGNDDQQAPDLVAFFEEHARSHPDLIAVSDESTELSYQATLGLIRDLSEALKVAGNKRHSRIALFLPRSIAVPVSIFAVLKAGGTYIPIDPDTPAERVSELLDMAEIDGVLTTSLLASRLSEIPLEAQTFQIILEDNGQMVDVVENSNPRAKKTPIESSAAAYILFTSGSTGKPKGVVVSRAALANYCLWATQYYCGEIHDDGKKTGASNRNNIKPVSMPFFTRLGFDLTITSLFVPWLTGGQIRVYKPLSESVDLCLPKIIKDDLVDIIKLTPSHLATIADHDLRNSRITQLIVGGEDFKVSLARQVHQSFAGNVVIHNEYGPTEATVGCVVHVYDPEADTGGSVPIGKPIADMRAVVLNDCNQIQPVGVTGTLWVSGPSLSNGYLTGRAGFNDSFQVFEHLDNARYYNTGDQVRLAPDGNYHYLGRNDDQHKIKGARVELAEIEEITLARTQVTQCVAIVQNESDTTSESDEYFCKSCGLSSKFPDVSFDSSDVCSLCNEFNSYKRKASIYFKSYPELEALAHSLKQQGSNASYDCMMLLSGGKDSTYALAKLNDLGLRVLAYTLDNGYLSSEAKQNVKRVCDALGIDHEFGKTPAMREIFADSLATYSNVCNGCFKTIYTLSLARAEQLDIKAIFTGLSRGQFFETRLTKELFQDKNITSKKIDETVQQARIAYHQTPDAVTRNLDTSHLTDSTIFERIQFHDFYRYCDVDLDELLDYLDTRLPWVRPKDTGRSTNCLINDVGIYVHNIERGFHNYSLPYSWDVRMGHKDRKAAMEELDDNIDLKQVNQILEEINYQPRKSGHDSSRVVLYYTAEDTLPSEQIKQQLNASLPAWMLPSLFMQLNDLPISKNGKIDRAALPAIKQMRDSSLKKPVSPSNELEQLICDLWTAELKIDQIGIHDNFFELGGDSLAGIRITAKLNTRGFSLSNTAIFENQTIAELASVGELKKQRDVISNATETVKPFASVSQGNLAKLSALLGKQESKGAGDHDS